MQIHKGIIDVVIFFTHGILRELFLSLKRKKLTNV